VIVFRKVFPKRKQSTSASAKHDNCIFPSVALLGTLGPLDKYPTRTTLSCHFPSSGSSLPLTLPPHSHLSLPVHVLPFPPLPPPLLPCTGAPWTFLTLPTPLLRHLASRGKNVHSEISGPRSSPGEGRDRERSSLNQVKLSFVTYAGAWLRN